MSVTGAVGRVTERVLRIMGSACRIGMVDMTRRERTASGRPARGRVACHTRSRAGRRSRPRREPSRLPADQHDGHVRQVAQRERCREVERQRGTPRHQAAEEGERARFMGQDIHARDGAVGAPRYGERPGHGLARQPERMPIRFRRKRLVLTVPRSGCSLRPCGRRCLLSRLAPAMRPHRRGRAT